MRTLQKKTYDLIENCINEYLLKHNGSPTLDEISALTNIPKTSVYRYVTAMKENGTIFCPNGKIVRSKKINFESINVPVLGSVSCGIPKFAEENIEEYVQLPISLFGNGDFFILRANGNSMIDAGIYDGDLVLIREQTFANEGQIVVALMEDEATLKRYYPEPEKKRIRLHPENKELKDIIVKNCIIQGVAVKVLKDLE